MSSIRSFAACTVTLASFAAAALSAQVKPTPQIQVLQLDSTPGVRNLPSQHAEGILSVRFDGHLTPGRNLYVRVFRDKLADLINTYPRQTQGNKCVLYTHASRFRVSVGSDHQLRMDDLLGFYMNATNIPNQTLTLVFEEGDDPDANGPLHLDKSAVADYFANAVVMPLLVTQNIQTQWAALNRQLDEAHRTWLAAQNGGHGWFGSKPVQAAETPSVPTPAAVPAPDKIFFQPCQVVKLIPSARPQGVASADSAVPEALSPIAIRQTRPCS